MLEIVSEPDIENAAEAKAYLKALRLILQYAGVICNMEEGSFRADTNLSVRKKNASELGTRCELKNINSFKFISDAIEYEVERQINLIESGGKVRQETRLWDSKNRRSVPMRSKWPTIVFVLEPDLSLIKITQETVERVKAAMPEMPYSKFHRYMKEFGVSEYEADIITTDIEYTKYFEELIVSIQKNLRKLVFA